MAWSKGKRLCSCIVVRVEKEGPDGAEGRHIAKECDRLVLYIYIEITFHPTFNYTHKRQTRAS